MGYTVQFVERTFTLDAVGMSGPAISRALAGFAKDRLAELIRSGEGSTTFERFVDGRHGAAEETVSPTGFILYQFLWFEEAAKWTLEFCRTQSKVLTGSYRDAWFIQVDSQPWDGASPIPRGAKVFVVNKRPYHRKLEMRRTRSTNMAGEYVLAGRSRNARSYRRVTAVSATTGELTLLVPDGIVQMANQAVRLKYGQVLKPEVQFITLPGGYILKGQNAHRRDSRAGQPMTYPALHLRLRE